jgi:hypothetical protein
MLCTATVIFDQNRRRDAVVRVSAVVFTLVVIAAQSRSVWVALIGGFMAVFLLSPNSNRRRQALGPLALGGFLAVLTLFGIIGGSIGTKLALAGTSTSTWIWRVESWQQLLAPWLSAPQISVILGEPFGKGLARVINGGTITVSAHSWYVELPLRVGVIGLLLWLILIVRGMAHARKVNTAALFYGTALLCFATAYVLPWNVAPWLGILLTCRGLRGVAGIATPAAPPAASLVDALDRSRFRLDRGPHLSTAGSPKSPTAPFAAAAEFLANRPRSTFASSLSRPRLPGNLVNCPLP